MRIQLVVNAEHPGVVLILKFKACKAVVELSALISSFRHHTTVTRISISIVIIISFYECSLTMLFVLLYSILQPSIAFA